MLSLKSILCLALVLPAILPAHLPSDFKLCRRNDPKVNDCLRAAIEDALRKLKDGSTELNLPPFEPLIIPSVEIGEGTAAVRFTQSFKDLKIHNTANSNVTSVTSNLDPKNFSLEVKTAVDEIKFIGDYVINGKILVFPIAGNGTAVITLKDVTFKCNLHGKSFTKKDGKDYMKIDQVQAHAKVGRLVMELENLFNGNEELGKRINTVLNENWATVYEESQRSYETIFEQVYMDYMNKFFNKIPYDELLP